MAPHHHLPSGTQSLSPEVTALQPPQHQSAPTRQPQAFPPPNTATTRHLVRSLQQLLLSGDTQEYTAHAWQLQEHLHTADFSCPQPARHASASKLSADIQMQLGAHGQTCTEPCCCGPETQHTCPGQRRGRPAQAQTCAHGHGYQHKGHSSMPVGLPQAPQAQTTGVTACSAPTRHASKPFTTIRQGWGTKVSSTSAGTSHRGMRPLATRQGAEATPWGAPGWAQGVEPLHG
jgi:hypothetical protein